MTLPPMMIGAGAERPAGLLAEARMSPRARPADDVGLQGGLQGRIVEQFGADRIEIAGHARTLDVLAEVTDPLSGFYTPYHGRSPRGLKMLMDSINKCNLRCVMCHFSYDSTQMEQVVQWHPGAIDIVEKGLLPHVGHMLLSVGTEPLMWKGFPRLLDALKRQQVPLTEMITNGLLLTEEMAERIVALPMTKVQLSLDGASAKTYNSVRIKGDFDRFVKKVEMLDAAKKKAGSAFPRLQFNFVMMRRNVDELEDLVRLAHRLGVEDLDLRHVVILENLGMEQESLLTMKEHSNEVLDRVRALCAELGLTIVTAPDNFHLESHDPAATPPVLEAASGAPYRPTATATPAVQTPTVFPELPTIPSKPSCNLPWKQFYVRPDGTVTPCCFWYTEESMGSLRTQTFPEIWEGPAYQKLRWQLLSGNLGTNCASCPVRGIGSVDDDNAHFAHNKEKLGPGEAVSPETS